MSVYQIARRLAELEKELRRLSTVETDPKDPRARREEELRMEYNQLLLAWRRMTA